MESETSKSEFFKAFLESLDQEKETEEKIRLSLECMRKILGETEKGSFKNFWDVKKLCISLFKEKINPLKRTKLWNTFTEISDEARQYKKVLDEQAAFSIEQIELAIEGLRKDIDQKGALIKQIELIQIDSILQPLLQHAVEYPVVEQELQLLKTLVTRVDTFRKEILSIDMRISHKNRILKTLSKLGDQIFPRRKELIKALSDAFISDVALFVKERFPEGDAKPSVPYYVIRSEIMSFQALAKCLTLNTHSFSKMRKMLSECWNKIKEQEKEHRKEIGERSEEQRKNFALLSEKVAAFIEFSEKEENLQKEKIFDASEVIQNEMRALSLSRDQVTKLKNQIQKARQEALDKIKGQVTKARDKEKKRVEQLKNELNEALKKGSTLSLDKLALMETKFKDSYKELTLSPSEQLVFERSFLDFQSILLDKKGGGALSKEELESLFDEREALFKEIKKQIEVYRKEMGGSGLDFEKAMTYRELHERAKAHFENEMEALQLLEEKLNED